MQQEVQPSWLPQVERMARHSKRDEHRPDPPDSGCNPGTFVLTSLSTTTTSLCKYTQSSFLFDRFSGKPSCHMFTHLSAMKHFINNSALGVARSLAHVTYTLPLLVQGLLPQGNLVGGMMVDMVEKKRHYLVIAAADCKDISGHRPADMPDDILKGVQHPEE